MILAEEEGGTIISMPKQEVLLKGPLDSAKGSFKGRSFFAVTHFNTL